MESKMKEMLGMVYEPVCIVWSHKKPENAAQFKEGRWGCVMWQFSSAAKGKTAVFDRKTYGCWGGGVGLGFGNEYPKFPGGQECFHYFLSIGNKYWETGRNTGEAIRPYVQEEFHDEFMEGERYVRDPEKVKRFVEQLPIVDIPYEYVIFKPLKDTDPEREKIASIVFPVRSHQLAALIVLANFGRDSFENVVVPWGAGCQSIGIYTYREMERKPQRAVIGMTDLSARKNIRKQLGDDIWTFSVPLDMFIELEKYVEESFLNRPTWLGLKAKE
ncbi:MAG: DUF169 domain-containing protein [Desulfatiglandales bacterium]